MRNQRKQDEQIVINLVSEALRKSGNEVIEDTNFDDNPDWVFSFNGKRIAADCCHIGLERLLEWSNCKRTMIPEKNYKIIFPVEPHLWIKKAIKHKEGKIPEYLRRSSPEEVWLITHSDFIRTGVPLYECSNWILEIMRSAAAAVPSGFSSLWFVDPEAGVNKLWDTEEPRTDFSSLDDVTRDSPVASYSMLIGTLTDADWSVSVGAENTVETITLQPLDRRYKIQGE